MDLEFKWVPPVITGQQVWGAASYPWTFVITQANKNSRYVASANDVRRPQPESRTNLGAEFTTLKAAQDACNNFLKKQHQ